MKRCFEYCAFIIAICCFLFCVVSCNRKAEYRFHHEEEEIKEIYIVAIHFDKDVGNYYTDDLKKIDDKESFLQEFHNLDCFMWWGDPLTLNAESDGKAIIKVVYSNGNYELIDWNGQTVVVFDDSNKHCGIRMFNEEQFNELVEKYIN